MRAARFVLLFPLAAFMASCASTPTARRMSEEECMTRVMYFESNRSSPEGMIAVGTVVMNRKASGKYPKTVCGVVGQKNQFAPGVLSRPMAKGRDLAQAMARKVLHGTKHVRVGRAMFFHTAGYSFPYTNMHYVAIAGGNAFYEKRKNATSSQDSIRRLQARIAAGEAQEPTVRRAPAQQRRGIFDFYSPDEVEPRRAPVRRIRPQAPRVGRAGVEEIPAGWQAAERRSAPPPPASPPQAQGEVTERLPTMSIEDLISANGGPSGF